MSCWKSYYLVSDPRFADETDLSTDANLVSLDFMFEQGILQKNFHNLGTFAIRAQKSITEKSRQVYLSVDT